jgi:putative ABC transport system substrate-binding protein
VPPEIGYLGFGTPDRAGDIILEVRRGLAETGYVDGKNLRIEYRWAEWQPERLVALADDLVGRQPKLIIMFAGLDNARAISRSTPVVFFSGVDPVTTGLVDSLNRPGANMTGVAVLNVDLTAKRLEILRQLVPGAKMIAYLGGPAMFDIEQKQIEPAAQALGLDLMSFTVKETAEFEEVFARIAGQAIGAVFMGQDPVLQRNSERVAALAARYKLPAIYPSRISVVNGGLVSYGTYYPEGYRIIGNYAGRILNGEKPADLPVQQLTRIELVLNLKAARAIGVEIPPTLLARADEVIE